MKRYKLRGKLPRFLFFSGILGLLFAISAFGYFEYRIRPLVSEAAASRGRSYATELINEAVTSAARLEKPLVSVSKDGEGVVSVETDVRALSVIRKDATEAIIKRLSDKSLMKFSVPMGNLVGSNIVGGRGLPVEIKLIPIGDVTADIETEFIGSGINQTLHKIILRIRVSFDIIAAGESLKVDLVSDISLAETVIVGKVPDAYTSINRYELDEDEENDLNDYAATLP